MLDFSFTQPWVFLFFPLLLGLKLFVKKEEAYFIMPHFAKTSQNIKKKSLLLKLLQWTLIFLTLLALAQPFTTQKVQITKENALDIVLSLDTSGSMSLYGFDIKKYETTRLQVVKELLTYFIQQRKNDRIALVLFGTNASIVAPLSFERDFAKSVIQKLKVGLLGKSTALLDSLIASVKLLKNSQSKSKIIILLSDGEDSSSKTPLSIALALLKKYHIKVYTIQIDKSQNNMMQTIAEKSGGAFFQASNKQTLQEVYAKINSLEKSKLSFKTISIKKSFTTYIVALALLMATILLLLRKDKEILI